MNTKAQKLEAFSRLLDIIDELREQCPWDKKQTTESLRNLTIEEVYELSEAITNTNDIEIKKELGDVLLHLVFYARIASEESKFDIADVINTLCDKLVFRHPHIYGDTQLKDEKEVLENWEKLKLKEGNKSVLGGVPVALPSLIKAQRIQEKAKAVKFDFENKQQAWEKVLEEISEFSEETDFIKQTEEFGDILFSLVNYARFHNINADDALQKTNQKFINRFQLMEKYINDEKLEFTDLNLDQLEVYYDKAKKTLKNK